MEPILWIICGCLLMLVLFLFGKIYLMKKSANEISDAFQEKLNTQTNTLIGISSRDAQMRKLADTINIQLLELGKQRHRFVQGDMELKEAIMNMSHDLRTPLTALVGYLDLLKQQEQSQKSNEYITMIQNRVQVLKQLTEELFQYSMMVSDQETDFEWISMNRVLEESLVSFYGVLTKREIIPVVIIPDRPINRYLNQSALIRIFSNVISNAVKYSDGDFFVQLKEDGTIVFQNHAKNLDAVTVSKLFNRFFTVENGQNSTGLGLCIAKTLTQQMSGTIVANYEKELLSIQITFPNEDETSNLCKEKVRKK